ncbi:Uncharacterised protein [BD1-7 clade bacterium]|uniref:Uncharacterized protein n=1 Tax=BD1-7 clade bacterium TaxID=2029982 RepID=A0A5S9PIL1_9GAMM|nr:Uncharacterised protein [BD1-7 clade bacterium]
MNDSAQYPQPQPHLGSKNLLLAIDQLAVDVGGLADLAQEARALNALHAETTDNWFERFSRNGGMPPDLYLGLALAQQWMDGKNTDLAAQLEALQTRVQQLAVAVPSLVAFDALGAAQ